MAPDNSSSVELARFDCRSENIYYDSQQGCINDEVTTNCIYESEALDEKKSFPQENSSIYEPTRRSSDEQMEYNPIYEVEPLVMEKSRENVDYYKAGPSTNQDQNSLNVKPLEANDNSAYQGENPYEVPCETLKHADSSKGGSMDNQLYAEVFKTSTKK